MQGRFMTSQYGSSINLSLNFGEYRVSIAADNSCQGVDPNMIRFYVAVLKGSREYVTNQVFSQDKLLSENEAIGTEENIIKAIEYCKEKEKQQ